MYHDRSPWALDHGQEGITDHSVQGLHTVYNGQTWSDARVRFIAGFYATSSFSYVKNSQISLGNFIFIWYKILLEHDILQH